MAIAVQAPALLAPAPRATGREISGPPEARAAVSPSASAAPGSSGTVDAAGAGASSHGALALERARPPLTPPPLTPLLPAPAPRGQMPAELAAAFPGPEVRVALASVVASYAEDVSVPSLVAAGLRSIQTVDPRLSVAELPGGIVLRHDGRRVGTFHAGRDMESQLRLVAQVWAAAAPRSAALRSLSAAEARGLFLTGVTAALDRRSRYLSAPLVADLRRALGREAAEGAPPTTGAAAAAPVSVSPPVSVAPGIALVRIHSFAAGTAAELSAALAPLVAGARGWVIDLRGNGGGLTAAAGAAADLFVAEGPVLDLRARDPRFAAYREAIAGDALETVPVALLVDATTASAAESFAAALSDRGRAVLIGTPTFGKGSAQWIAELPTGDAVAVTVGRFYGPGSEAIEGVGRTPALCGADPAAALARLRGSGASAAPPCAPTSPDLGRDLDLAVAVLSDAALLRRALEAQRPAAAAPR